MPDPQLDRFWGVPTQALVSHLETTQDGLTQSEAQRRLSQVGPNTLTRHSGPSVWGLLLSQFQSPLVLILVGACVMSLVASEWVDAAVVLAIVLISTLMGFAQETMAHAAMEKLRAHLNLTVTVVRDGQARTLSLSDVVPGDVVTLCAGSLVPADGVVLQSHDCFVNQSMLTGESVPVEKMPGQSAPDATLTQRLHALFMGTSVSSGTARLLVVHTGAHTQLGQLADRLTRQSPPTAFEQGVQRLGYLLTRIMLVMVVLVLGLHLLMHRPAMDSLLFALALSVGLTPELLPAIVSITLSHGAKRMAALGVIVRRLSAIENLGSMDVLCTDKTGTLTAGVMQLDGALNPQGQPSDAVLQWAALNAQWQTGLSSPLDQAIVAAMAVRGLTLDPQRRIDEIPYDFERKCLSVVVASDQGPTTLITKGALRQVLSRCTQVGEHAQVLDAQARDAIERQFNRWSQQGYRVLGVATRTWSQAAAAYSTADEQELCFAGFLLFQDPIKPGVQETLAQLAARGVSLKIITGDNPQVALHVAAQVGVKQTGVLSGSDLQRMGERELMLAVRHTQVFADVDPGQKERLLRALQRAGHVVGYLGDGINDALALHTADVGISVDTAVDVAKDAADLVLLRKDLGVLLQGITEGRNTFANTLKYLLTVISANFGNMVSMALASVFLPFLPLLATQILLNNLLADLPAMAIARDRVDAEWVLRPRRWDTAFIRDYMVTFGLISTLYDLLTFGLLLWVFQAAPAEFRTGWFVESLLTELLVALVVRTQGPCYRSRPATSLLVITAMVVCVALILPYSPVAALFDFVPLPPHLLLALVGVSLAYAATVEWGKQVFYRRR
ncbi:MAG: Magnesium-transporting ATPase, P-type 1 [Pseudomonadota bacterium]